MYINVYSGAVNSHYLPNLPPFFREKDEKAGLESTIFYIDFVIL